MIMGIFSLCNVAGCENFHCSCKFSIFISCPRGWRHLSEYYLAIVGWLSSGSPAGGRQMFRGDPIRRPPKQCATINHQTIYHPLEQSSCLDDHEPKYTQPFGLVFFFNLFMEQMQVSICFHGYTLIISYVMMRVVKIGSSPLCSFYIVHSTRFNSLLDIICHNIHYKFAYL